MTNETNITEPYDLSLKFVFDVTLPTASLIIALSCICILKTFLKKLYVIIKNILYVQCIHNAMASALVLISVLFWPDEYSLEKCGFTFVISRATAVTTIEMLTVISFVRYYLAYKTSKREGFNVSLLTGIVSFIYLAEYIIGKLIFEHHSDLDLCTPIDKSLLTRGYLPCSRGLTGSLSVASMSFSQL